MNTASPKRRLTACAPAGGSGGGLHHEGEDIEVIRMPFTEALRLIETGDIADAKTILLLQFAALKRVFS